MHREISPGALDAGDIGEHVIQREFARPTVQYDHAVEKQRTVIVNVPILVRRGTQLVEDSEKGGVVGHVSEVAS